MPKVVLYVPVALHREIELLADVNGYSTADDMIRALALATLDELVTGVQMHREVNVPAVSERGGSGEAATLPTETPKPRSESAELAGVPVAAQPMGAGSRDPRQPRQAAAPDHFKPDFKQAKKK